MDTATVSVARDIVLGSHDRELDAIIRAARERQETIAGAARFTLKAGDTVRFNGRIRPKYLCGLTATVVKVNQKTVTVSCPSEPQYGKYMGSAEVRCPLSLIEQLPA